MKATTLASRLNSRYTGSKSTIAYRIVCDIIAGTNKTYTMRDDGKIRPCYTSGSGRFTSNQDHTESTKAILDMLGVKYVAGNDAPKGGATGNFIKVTSKIAR
jgi:hypothetical protein